MNIETVAYQAQAAAKSRPCGARPCDREFPGMPSRVKTLIAGWRGDAKLSLAHARGEADDMVHRLEARADAMNQCADELEPVAKALDAFIVRLRGLPRYWTPVDNSAHSVPAVLVCDVERLIAERHHEP
jgi:hypothetical protein